MNAFKNSIVLSLVLASGTAMATNGDNMIAFGAKSMALGGAGIALTMGPESALKNPALLTETKDFEFLFAGTLFSPDVETQKKTAGNEAKKSAADKFMIPAIGLSHRISDNFTFGLGAYGTSGLGVDYRDTSAGNMALGDDGDGLYRMSTSLSLMKFVPTLAYKWNDLSVGIGLAVQYGSLGISYDTGDKKSTTPGTPFVGGEGYGTSDDLGTGFDIGLAYKWNTFMVGFNYQSPIVMEYKNQIKQAVADFGITSITSDKLEQPGEIGAGFSYVWDRLTATFDYKMIRWEDADGYKEFGWDNQNVYAMGLQYQIDKTSLRVGYNYAKSPLGDKALTKAITGNTDQNGLIHLMNGLGFPAIIESHITLGAGQKFTERFTADFAAVFAKEIEKVGKVNNGMNQSYDQNIKHSQTSFTLAGHWMF